ncbi:MAG: hypothetical protein QHG99_03455 [Methanomicrobiales archaeon]|nr:hypothetical protein [Methanomicrobiales archaeon]
MIPRYLIYLLAFYFPGIAVCIRYAYGIIGARVAVYLALFLLILAALPFYAGYYTAYSKEDWRGFAGVLANRTADGDIVVAAPGYMRQSLDYYYHNATDRTLEFGANNALELQAIRNAHPVRGLFVVVTGDIHAANPEGDALKWMEEHTTLASRYTGIYLFVTK